MAFYLYLSYSCRLELDLQLPLLAARFACQFHYNQFNSHERRITNYITFTFASFIPQELDMQ